MPDADRSPFTRPGFMAAAGLIAAIVIASIIIAVVGLGGGSSRPAAHSPRAAATHTAAPTPPPHHTAGPSQSICGLPGTVLSGSVTTTPKTVWKYQGVVAYPSSTSYGPGKTAPVGYRYCFQHSPAGAVFATGNAITNALSPAAAGKSSWINYFVSQGRYRHQTITGQGGGSSAPPPGEQVTIEGFRLLGYTGDSATVALAVHMTGQGHSELGSFTYALIWQNGDWKLDASTTQSFSAGPLSSLQNYVQWKAAG